MLTRNAACRLAKVNPYRLNEAIAAGFYPCAPQTKPGSRRMFSENDAVKLCVFGSLLGDGYPPRAAGKKLAAMASAIDRGDSVWRQEGEDFTETWLLGNLRETVRLEARA